MQQENVKLTKNQTLTGKDVLVDNISLGGMEEKKTGKFNYCMTQVLYDEKPFILLERGKMKIFFIQKNIFRWIIHR